MIEASKEPLDRRWPALGNSPQSIAATEEPASPQPDPATVATLAQLERTAAEALERGRQASLVERAVRRRREQGPAIHLEAAVAAAPLRHDSGAGIGWLMASLAAGLATAVGVGLTSTGLAMQRPLDSIQRIEAVSAIPVIAVIPPAKPPANSPAPSRHRAGLRTALVLGGVLIIAASSSVVVAALL